MNVVSANKETYSSPTGTLSKVPQVTIAFWVIKIAAPPLGETCGDALSGKQRTTILGG
jgi:uncharacterized membrane-anchored protein